MIVRDLLRLEDLQLALAWGTPELLDRQVTGVTSTDLQDPARYLQRGELVLSGLVWWKPDESGQPQAQDAALRFATSLRSARVAALLAGEGTHGRVPPSLVDACRVHDIPLISIPAGVSFRAVTDRIYLRLWGDLNSGANPTALPESVRQELAAMLAGGAPPAPVLARAVARLGLPHCSVLSAAGRVIAASDADAGDAGNARDQDGGDGGGRGDGLAEGRVPVGPPGASPFDGWYLTGASAPSLALADLLTPFVLSARSQDGVLRSAAAELFDLLAAAGTADRGDLAHALSACALPADAPLRTLSARIDRAPTAWAVDALTELLHLAGARFVAGTDERGEAAAVVAGPVGDLRPLLPRLQALLGPGQVLRIGVGPGATATVGALRAALVGARYALASADRYAEADRVDSLAALLAGIPPQVTAAFHERLLGPLLANDRDNNVSLLETLTAFLDHDGSWSRTAQALHVHVNTVHYRARRIEELTGRSLVRLADRTDLRAALLCRPRAGSGSGAADG